MDVSKLLLEEMKKHTHVLSSIQKDSEKTNELLTELIAINRETLNFFVAVEERESGVESSFNQEYLTEIKKDGFKPPNS
mgnify:CR=1 FL=1|jgi:hypothetical protein